jgi:replicative DNA helicase
MEETLNNRSATSLADKLPPQNLEAERACLGSMLLDREAIEVAIELLKDEEFYSLQHKII